KGKEPSAPKKIGYGMILTAAAFSILVIGSIGLPSPAQLGGQVAPPEHQVSVYWLISTYFMLTIAELFLSPMGISFVSKVAPPKYKGLMQGGWFAATAIGNYLVGVVGWLWMKLPLWALWSILVVACLLSAAFMFSIMKKLEKVAAN
ncbi:MAG TPA: MFS transporter, partial [Candidatus Saccharicenans sp.]|nr:MFS transporter [Candidatus Saccharicenans sp.]